MTEEAPDQSFGRYLTAKKAAVTYGLSAPMHDCDFTVTSSNSAAWGKHFTTVEPSQAFIGVIPIDDPNIVGIQPHHGIGKCVFIDNFAGGSSTSEILPTSLITSNTGEMLFPVSQTGNMATQQPVSVQSESIEEIIWRV